MNLKLALLALISKFIHHMFIAGVFYYLLNCIISAIIKYYITDKKPSLTLSKYSLLTPAKKAYWQLQHPIPKYQGIYVL